MNLMPAISDIIIDSNCTLLDAMQAIEKNTLGICFVINDGVMVGIISDGDIRRALMKGAYIEQCVCEIMQKTFVSLPVNTSLEKIQEKLNERIRVIPIIENSGRVVDYACAKRYHQIPLTQPVLDGNELEYVTDCIKTGWISSQGKYVRLFEDSFKNYVGCSNALAVSNGTVALHLALITLGIGPGDEVIVPDLTFAAPVNAVIYVGATPVLVDVDQETMTLNMDAAEKAITKRTRAIIPVHLYGHPANMDKVMNLATQHDLFVVEDCAEALGTKYKGTHVGNFGHAAIFSFFGNKTITTGEGGMLLLKDADKFIKANQLRDHGMSKDRRYWHEHIGYNYRMTNIQAAIGVAQLERINLFVERKRWNANQYQIRLSNVPGIQLIKEIGDVINSYWFYTIVLPAGLLKTRDEIIKLMLENGVEARPTFYPIHCMPPYLSYLLDGQSFPVSDSISNLGISLPSGVEMSESEIDRVCSILKRIIRENRNSEQLKDEISG